MTMEVQNAWWSLDSDDSWMFIDGNLNEFTQIDLILFWSYLSKGHPKHSILLQLYRAASLCILLPETIERPQTNE